MLVTIYAVLMPLCMPMFLKCNCFIMSAADFLSVCLNLVAICFVLAILYISLLECCSNVTCLLYFIIHSCMLLRIGQYISIICDIVYQLVFETKRFLPSYFISCLTHCGLAISHGIRHLVYIYSGKTIASLSHHYVYWCWLIVLRSPSNQLQGNLNQATKLSWYEMHSTKSPDKKWPFYDFIQASVCTVFLK